MVRRKIHEEKIEDSYDTDRISGDKVINLLDKEDGLVISLENFRDYNPILNGEVKMFIIKKV